MTLKQMDADPTASNLTTTGSHEQRKKKRRGGKKVQEKIRNRMEREHTNNGPAYARNIDQDESPLFQLRDAGPKGLGLFAARDILPGRRILQESPLFIISRGEEEDMVEDVMTSFQNLTSAKQGLFFSLSNCIEEETKLDEVVTPPTSEDSSTLDDKVDSIPAVVDDQYVPGVCHGHRISEAENCPACCSDSGCGALSVCKGPNEEHKTANHSYGTASVASTASQTDSDDATSVQEDSNVSNAEVDPLCDRDENVVLSSESSTEADAGVSEEADAGVSEEADTQTRKSESPPSSTLGELDELYIADALDEDLRSRITNIWRTNSYGLDDGLHLDTAGIAPTLARLNHSCNPNVYCAFNSTTNKLTVHAVKPIARDEQLFTSYIQSSFMLRPERHASLRKWGFECDCPACAVSPDDANESSRRTAIKALSQSTAEIKAKFAYLSPQQLTQAAHDLLHMATLMTEEGLLNPDLADVYLGAAMCYARIGLYNQAQVMQEKRLELMIICYGSDSPVLDGNGS